jgi:uncharacterized membrane protein YqjE
MSTTDVKPGTHITESEPSFGELVAAASRDLSSLIHTEIELAKTEIMTDVKAGAAGAGALMVAGAFGFFLFEMLLVGFAEGLVTVGFARWAAYLVVAGVLLVFAGIVGVVGLIAVRHIKAPRRTIETTKDTVAMVKSRKLSPPPHTYSDGGRTAQTVPQHHG